MSCITNAYLIVVLFQHSEEKEKQRLEGEIMRIKSLSSTSPTALHGADGPDSFHGVDAADSPGRVFAFCSRFCYQETIIRLCRTHRMRYPREQPRKGQAPGTVSWQHLYSGRVRGYQVYRDAVSGGENLETALSLLVQTKRGSRDKREKRSIPSLRSTK